MGMPLLRTRKPTGRAYGGRSAEQRRAARREKFIQAGLEVFGRQGYRAGTVRVLCKKAGLTDRYFYESFASTEDLLKAVYEQQSRMLYQRLMGAVAVDSGAFEQRIRAGVAAFFDVMRNPLTARVILVEVLGVSRAIDAAYQNNTRRFATVIVGLVQSVLPLDRLNPHQQTTLGAALVGACTMSAAQWLIEDYASPQESVIEACTLVLTGTVAALRVSPATPDTGSAQHAD